MRTLTTSILLLTIILSATYAQQKQRTDTKVAIGQALQKFPGFDTTSMQKLVAIKKKYGIPLPTWIPDGFKVEKVSVKVNGKFDPMDQGIAITYSKKLPDGKKQSFIFEGAIDGIGDLLYQHTHIIKSALGEIELCYEPKDEDNSKTLKNYVRTQWFDCNGTAWAYSSCKGIGSKSGNTTMIPIDETKKILASLQQLK
ncbi:MAG: hypothetical protein K0Q79_574 [Flavipsychrobacter sp.]|jgi:hypothetical protein|nr:hypothetical protein [Flavipsychrobacter sp.]